MKSIKVFILLAIFIVQAFAPVGVLWAATTITSITSSVSKITDAIAGQAFSITVTFSDPMDTGTDPTIILRDGAIDLTASGTLTFTGTTWSSDGMTYAVNYIVNDQDEQFASVDATVLGANPLALPGPLPPEPPISYNAPNLFSVDTLTPLMGTAAQVVSVVTTAPVIKDSLAGQTFSIVVTYDAPLDPSDEPTVTLTPNLYGSTLTFTGTTWLNSNTVYRIDCTVNDLDEELGSVSARILGGTTAFTVPPLMVASYDAPNLFSVDTKAPGVTPGAITTAGATGNAGFYKIGDTVSVSWDAAADGVIDAVSMSVDFSAFEGGIVAATRSGSVWTALYTIAEGSLDPGLHINPIVTIADSAGNTATAADDVNASVDNKINGYLVSVPVSSISSANQTAFSFSFQNAEVGATYEYDINGAVAGSGTIGLPNGTVSHIDVSSIPDGSLTLTAHLIDAAGNVGNLVSAAPITKDTIPLSPAPAPAPTPTPFVPASVSVGSGTDNTGDDSAPAASAPNSTQNVPVISVIPERIAAFVPSRFDPTSAGIIQQEVAPIASVLSVNAPATAAPSAKAIGQGAAASNALNDLFSGSKIYNWMVIAVCLIVLGRVIVLLTRREDARS